MPADLSRHSVPFFSVLSPSLPFRSNRWLTLRALSLSFVPIGFPSVLPSTIISSASGPFSGSAAVLVPAVINFLSGQAFASALSLFHSVFSCSRSVQAFTLGVLFSHLLSCCIRRGLLSLRSGRHSGVFLSALSSVLRAWFPSFRFPRPPLFALPF